MSHVSQVSGKTGAPASRLGAFLAVMSLIAFGLFLVLLTFYPELSSVPVPVLGGLSLIYVAATVVFLAVVSSVILFSWLSRQRPLSRRDQ